MMATAPVFTHNVIFFANGNTAVFQDGDQVPILQESWLLLFTKFLEEHGVDPLGCEFTLPFGTKATIFRRGDGKLNWKVEYGNR